MKNPIPNLTYFYGQLGYRLVILIFTSILVGLLDGLGITMFLPLLELVSDSSAHVSPEKLGNLSFLLRGLQSFGFGLTLNVVLLTMFVFFIFKGLATFAERYMRVVYQQYFIAKIRLTYLDALRDYDFRAFVTADAGLIQNSITGEVERVMQAFRSYGTILQQLAMMLTYLGLAFMASPEFAVLIAVGGVLSNFLFSLLYKKTKVLSSELVQRNHTFQGYVIQAVSFFKYLKATAYNEEYTDFLKRNVIDIEKTNKKMGVLNSIMLGFREPLMIGIVVVVILVQIYFIGGALGTIILSLLFFYRGLTSLTALQTAYNQFLGFSGSLENMSSFTNELKRHTTLIGNKRFIQFRSKIILDNVSFSYDGINLILNKIDLVIYRNETLALVGESGSGKTTLANLLCGLLKPDSGQLLVDGENIVDYDVRTLQKRIGYITQDPVIFDDTVWNNVTFWAEKNSKNSLKFYDSLKKAHIIDFIDGLSSKGETRLGNNGITLSGGQRQRISIARELFKEVDFLFMDEATSALDSETERSIQNNIDELKGQFTIVMIAHRLSTIRNANRVVVLNQGSIESIGTYDEVYGTSKLFKNMVELQEI
ncbi:MAG: ABC transporter ATP-binding protein [Bacteroidetes bacterium]|nr:MAG: ABC transporter ATP-binding protein [Bacteroidota bacterium]